MKVCLTGHEAAFTFEQTPRVDVLGEKGCVDGDDGGVEGARAHLQDDLGDLRQVAVVDEDHQGLEHGRHQPTKPTHDIRQEQVLVMVTAVEWISVGLGNKCRVG